MSISYILVVYNLLRKLSIPAELHCLGVYFSVQSLLLSRSLVSVSSKPESEA